MANDVKQSEEELKKGQTPEQDEVTQHGGREPPLRNASADNHAPSIYGDGGTPIAHCKRDQNGKILFPGDWCSASNGPAKAGCADSMQLLATYAASAVKLLP